MKREKLISGILLLSVLLCNVFSIPVNAADTTVTVGSVSLSAKNPYWKNDNTLGDASDWNAYFDAEQNQLILNNAKITTGLVLRSTTLRILGDCEISNTNQTSSDSIALYFINAGSSSLVCDGTLLLSGGNASSSFNSYGIYSTGSLSISGGGTLTATAGTGNNSFGIFCTGDVKIFYCTIQVSASTSKNLSYGIFGRYGSITVSDATGSVSGENGAFNQKPTFNVPTTGVYSDKEMTFGKVQKETVSIAEAPQRFTYQDDDISFKISGTTLSGFVVSYMVNNAWTSKVPTVAGSYDVQITRSEDDTYDAFQTIISDGLIIDKKTVIAPEAGEKLYTGSLLVSDLADTELYTVAQNDGGIAVGEYDVVLSLVDSNNYKWESTESASITVKFYIVGTSNTISTVTISDWTYGETPSEPFAVSSYGEVKYRYYTLDDTPLHSRPTEAGTYKVQAYVSADVENYDTVCSELATFTIHKAEVKIPENAGRKAYTGTLLVSDLADTELYTVTQNDGGIAVGEYDVILSLVDSKNYKWKSTESASVTVKFYIVGTSNTISTVTISDWTYGETPSEPFAVSSYGEVKYRYYTLDDTLLNSRPTDAGTYKVQAYVSADGENYDTVCSELVAFTIHKAEVKVPESAGRKAYTGTLLVSDLVDTELYTVTQNDGGIAVGEYDVVLSLVDSNNYKWESTESASITVKFYIVGTSNTISTVTISDWTYGETPSEPFAVSSYGEVKYRYYTLDDTLLNSRPTDAGTYKVQAYVSADGENYDTVCSELVTFTIHKAEVKVPENAGRKAYTGSLLISDIFDTDFYIVTKNEGGINAGEYDVVLTLRDDKNYRWAKWNGPSVTIKLIIVAMDNEVSDVFISDWIYGDKPSTPQAFSRFGTVEFRYYTSEGEMLASCPTQAGTYKIKAYIPADGKNYEAIYSENFTTFTIHKKAIAIPESAGSKVYNGHLQTSDLDDTKYFSVIQYGGTDVGTYPVILSLKDTNNCYWAKGDEVADKELSFTIEKFIYNSIGSFYMKDRTFGEAFEEPIAYSTFGEIRFTYSSEENGNYTETVPKKAGTWYVKAKVSNTKNYNGCEAIRSFVIEKAIVEIPKNAGFTLYNGEKQKSFLTETDDYTVIGNRGGVDVGDYEIILRLKNTENTCWSDGSVEEKTLIFTIMATDNEVSDVIISDWIYGNDAGTPFSTATYGEVAYEFYTMDGIPLENPPKNAGLYQVRAYVENGMGRQYSENFTAFAIYKIKVALPSTQDIDYIYDGEIHHYMIEKSEYYTVVNDRRVQVGTQQVSVILNDKENYIWANGSAEDLIFDFTVQKAPSAFVVDGETPIVGFLLSGVVGAVLGVSGTIFWNRFSKKTLQKRKNNR